MRVAVFSLIAATLAAPAAAERYAVTFAGAPLMTVAVKLSAVDGAYSADIRAEGDLVAGIDARLSGTEADGMRRYSFDASYGGWRQRTRVETTPGMPPRRVQPSAGARIAAPLGALDPVAALVVALRAAEDDRCPSDMTVFDGWRTIAIDFGEMRTDGATDAPLRCGFAVDVAVAGGADPHGLDALLDGGEALFDRQAGGRAQLKSLRIGNALFGLRADRIDPAPPKPKPAPPLERTPLDPDADAGTRL